MEHLPVWRLHHKSNKNYPKYSDRNKYFPAQSHNLIISVSGECCPEPQERPTPQESLQRLRQVLFFDSRRNVNQTTTVTRIRRLYEVVPSANSEVGINALQKWVS